MQVYTSTLEPFEPKLLTLPGEVTASMVHGAPWITDDTHLVLWGGDYAVVRDDGTLIQSYSDKRPYSQGVRLVPGKRTILFD